MKNLRFPVIALLLTLMTFLQSCEVVGGIFKAGMWVGVSIVLLVIVGIIWLFSRARR